MERKIDLENSLRSFNTFANNNKVTNAVKILKTINDFFDEQNSEIVMDLSVQLVLDPGSPTSLVSFLKKKAVMKNIKELKTGIFELFRKLITRYTEKVKQFASPIVENCTRYIEAYEVSAREKELAVQTLQDMVANRDFDSEIEYEKLVKQLMGVFDHRNPTNRFLQYTFELLGLISKKCPQSFQLHDGLRFRELLIAKIENLFKDDNNISSLSVIAGVLDCLSNHLVNFAPSISEENDCKAIYVCVKELSDPNKINVHDKTAFRNSLKLFSEHGYLMGAQIFQDYIYWHKILEMWVKRPSYEERKSGIQATYRFHQELANQIEARKNDEDKKILQYFMNNFKKTLQSSNSETFEIRIAIKGIGQMAPAHKALLPSEYLTELFDLVMERTEYSYHTNDKMKRRDVLEHLPAYVESLSKIMSHITELSGIQLIALENIIIILIKDFHFLSQYHHSLIVTALLNTFKNIQKLGGKILDDSLDKIVMQGIIYSCSHQLVYDMQENIETVKDWKETITYKRYLPLWIKILYDPGNIDISSIIYDHFIGNLFKILKKLNLNTIKRKFASAEGEDREFYFNDPSIDLEPVNAKDFMIFYNLVDFCCDIFKSQSLDCLNQNFKKWIHIYVTTMCDSSMENPLVSGYLKLLETGLTVVQKLNYINPEIADLLVNFIKNLLIRIKRSSGELQISCLCVMFAMPTSVLLECSPDLPEIFVIGFNLGKSLLWIADKSLTCFENVINELDNCPESRKMLLELVFPCFDGFFQGKVSNLTIPQIFSKKINSRYKRNYFKKQIGNAGKNELQELQKKILSFLGNFDPDECLYMIGDSEMNQQLVQENTMIYRIRLESNENFNPAIFLDSIIPRLCYLTQSSSDRSTKVSACELLHGLVLYKMGKPDTSDEEPELWRTLMEQMIVLGSSSTDLTARQLFEPLLMQIMHFYSKSDRITSKTTTVTVEVLYSMICHPTDSCVQDLSARLLRELILWSIKQTSISQRNASPVKLVDIFHELKKMSINVDENRRRGAVTAFNNIYRIIREEQSLVDVYWLYLIDIMAANFKMSEDLNQDLDNRKFDHLSSSLDHLTRVVVERKDLFKISNSDRIKPKGFTGVTIEHLVVWLFQQCGSKQYNFRHKIMNDVFLRITEGAWSLNQFVDQQITLERILTVGEGGKGGIAGCEDLNFVKNVKFSQIKEIHLWLEHFLKSLDFYTWIFKQNIMKLEDFEGFSRDSKIFKVLIYFLEELCHDSPLEILEKINESSLNTSQFSLEFNVATKELDNLKNIKCLIIVKILDFVNVLLTKQNILDQFLLENHSIIIKLLVELIFRPQYYECKNYDRDLENVLKSLLFNAPDTFRKRLIENLSNELANNIKTLTDTCGLQMEEYHVDLKSFNVLNGIKLIVKNYKDYSSYFPESANALFKNSAELLLLHLNNGLVGTNQTMKCLSLSAKSYVKLAFEISSCIEDLLKKIVDFCLEDKLLKKSSSISIKHGEYFLEIFKNSIFNLFAQRIEDTLDLFLAKMDSNNCLEILEILTKFNDFLFKQKSSGDDEILKINIEATFKKWDKILEWTQTLDNPHLALINFVMHLAIASPIELHLLGENLNGLKQWLLEIISSSRNSLELKAKAISLLPCITSRHDRIDQDLSDCLLALQQKHFPMKSNEFKEDSLERAGLVSIMEKLLSSLVYSRSPVILKFLIEATISDDNHIMEQKISESLKEFMEKQEAESQKFINQSTFDFFLNEKYDPLIRLNVVTRFLLVLLRSSSVEVVLDFFQQNIRKIHTLIQSRYSSIDGKGYYAQQAFINRSGAYLLIETMAAVLPKQKIHDTEFNCMGKTMSGKEVIDDLIKKSKAVREEIYVVQNDIQSIEMFRKYQCYAYRALCSLVSNTRENIGLFALCLFKEVTNKNQYLWQKIIDVQNDHLYSDFTQDFEEYPKTKQFIVSIKETLSTMQINKDENTKYLRSISVFESSLSQSLTKTDLNYSVVYSKRELQEKELQDLQEEKQKSTKISLESTPINDHEIMSVLVGVVNHIFGNLTSSYEAIPKWAEYLASSLNDHLQHKNVKMFLAKLIENCRNHFKHYASIFMEPIMRLIVHKIAGDQLNFFITDMVAMLLSWHNKYKPTTSEEIFLARRLLEFLMENSYHERREIFKMNLEIVKKLVELWRDVLTDLESLSDKIMPNTFNSVSQIECKIQLNAVLLANNLTPWGTNSSNKINFLKAVIKCCEHENAKVHSSASQLLGMCLQALIKEPPQDGDENHLILNSIYEVLDKLQRNKSSDFLGILYGIHKNFPAIVDKYLTYICFHLPNSIKKVKSMMLEMFLARLETYGHEIYRQLNAIGLEMCLKDKSYQLLALHILNKSLAFVKPAEIENLLEQIYSFSESSDPECKYLFYEILLYIMEKFKEHLKDPRKPIRYLLKGLIDTDLDTHNRVLAFFSKDEILSKNFNERFLVLLKDFYDPSLEKEFLHYASFLLLEISVKHPRSSRTLLDYDPRTAINYFEYQVSTKLSSQSIPPMFLETQQKQLLAGDGSQMQDLIKATQDNNNFFEPTQDPNKLSEVPQSFSLKETQNSLYFNLAPQYLDKRSNKMSQDNVLSQEEAIAAAKSAGPDTFDYLRRRVIRDEKRSAKNQATRAIEYRQFAIARNDANREKKEGNVVLYRRYRVGDFPDFYFNSLAILLPLQSLVKKDDKIARAVFLAIFNSILDIFQEQDAEDADKEFFDSINKSIVCILETMKTYDSFLFSTLMELVLKSGKYLKISPETIVAVSGMNNMFVTGILFLESQINLLDQDEDESSGEPSTSKRLRIDEKEQKKFHWIKLTELYYSLSEYEIISGIFTEKLDVNLVVKEKLNRAIGFESDGNYGAASNLYSEIINENLYRDSAERDFYYQSHFNCLINLGDWNTVSEVVGKQFTSSEEIWSERFNTDVLLPLIMKSELRKIIKDRRSQKSFLNILEKWLNVEDRCEYLHANFGEEMTLLMMCSEEFKKSCVEAEQTLKQFSEEWSCLDSLLEKLRIGKLMNARNVAELWNFNTSIFQEETVTAAGISKLTKLWKRSKPKESDSLVIWDTIIAYRKYLFELARSSMEDSELDLSELKSSLIENQLNLLNVAVHQKNLTYAKNLWMELDKSLKNHHESSIKHEINASKLQFLKADLIKIGSDISGEELAKSVLKKSNCLYTGWHHLRNSYEKIEGNSSALQVEILEQLGAASYGFLKISPHIHNHPQPQNFLHNLLALMGSEDDQNLENQLINHSYKCFRKAKEVAERVLNYDSVSFSKEKEKERIIGDAYLKLGKFCYNIYKDENQKTDINLQKEILVSVFRALDNDCQEAKLFIPCVLQLEDLKNNKLTAVFDEEIESIPEWIFLGYISQILSNFDFEENCYLDSMLYRIAKKYPRALYFPFKMSLDHYRRSPDRGLEKSLIPELNELIESPLMKNFEDGMLRLCLPKNIVDFHFGHLKDCLDDQSISNEQFQKEVQYVIDLLYRNNRFNGEEFHTIAEFEAGLESLQSLKLPEDRSALKEKLKKLILSINKPKTFPDTIELHRLSKFLSEYKWLGTQEYLELPGQYTGDSKPFVESHVKIVRFESRLKVFTSKQSPIELKMHGSDGRTYKSIVKYGEDLRQDQRVQQILKLMSDRLQMDKNCKLNKLKVSTYQVTPINYFCGILSVIEDTITVREFAKKCSSSNQMEPTDIEKMILSVRAQYRNFMQEVVPNLKREDLIYSMAVQKLPKESIREKFLAMEASIPANVLKINLSRNAASVETFYILRKNFINSMAVMNICHWILGVGDRHLMNILIAKKTGILIGIDFGLAFGAATRNLAIPEMIPFRLTSHFVNVLEPMRISGLIRKNMMHTLKCLRNVSDTILIALTMFTKEPTIDWLKEAKRIYSSSDTSGIGAVLEWNPETRVKIAERKLAGANCRKITADELSSGIISSNKEVLEGYLNILNGDESDVRAVMADDGLSVEEQVSCLIDQATDPCILGLTYRGWDPWF